MVHNDGEAFESAKMRLRKATGLAFLQQGARLALATDASSSHAGAALHQQKDDSSTRQQQQLSYIAEFTGNLVYCPGWLNIVADTQGCCSGPLPLSQPQGYW